MRQYTVAVKQSESGAAVFEMPAPALLYRRGSPRKCTNIACEAKLQCFTNKERWHIGIWAQGIHIQIPLADIAALVETATDTIKGFGG